MSAAVLCHRAAHGRHQPALAAGSHQPQSRRHVVRACRAAPHCPAEALRREGPQEPKDGAMSLQLGRGQMAATAGQVGERGFH